MKGIQINNLTTELFKNLSFELVDNGLVGLVGHNGVGKSTLFSILNREVKLSSNTINVGQVCYIPSLDIFDKNLSANDYYQLLSKNEQITFDKTLEAMGGANYFNKRIGKYSLGMKEYFAFIFAISIKSDVLILDELIDGLDERKRYRALSLLKEYGREKIILFTSHNLSEVFHYCETVYLLKSDRLMKVDEISEVNEIYQEINMVK